jgi:hypothetical protein
MLTQHTMETLWFHCDQSIMNGIEMDCHLCPFNINMVLQIKALYENKMAIVCI